MTIFANRSTRRLVAAVSLTFTLFAGAPSAVAADCSANSFRDGGCPTPSVNNGGVSLGANITVPGASAGPGEEKVWAPGYGPNPRSPNGYCLLDDAGQVTRCFVGYTVTSPLDGRGRVTIADLVNFAPTVTAHRMEPGGWMVVGLHTNFYIETATQVQDDLLLGSPASVRFTPVAYRWNYGDGTSVRLTDPGASWAQLGLGEFDQTSTSHVFRTPGTFVVDASVDFRADYRFGAAAGAWIPIDGTVNIPVARLTATAQSATTVLVTGDCTKIPTAPGC